MMRRILGLVGRIPRRRIPVHHVLLLVFFTLLALLGVRNGRAPAGPAAKEATKPQSKPLLSLVRFSRLRPRTGDHMVLPRIGFRWSFGPGSEAAGDSGAAEQASFVPSSFLSGADSIRAAGTNAIRFLLHLVGPGGRPEIVRETTASEINLDLKGKLPAGECEWWVEAKLPGHDPVCSGKERFVLQP